MAAVVQRERSRSPSAAMTIGAQAERLRQEERKIQGTFRATAADLGQDAFADAEEFPLTAEGELYWHDQQEVHRLIVTIRSFLVLDSVVNGGRAQLVWPRYMAAANPWMGGKALEVQLLALVLRCYKNRREKLSYLEYIEYFCGCGNLSKSAIKQGLRGASLDLEQSEDHDCLTPGGLRLWLAALCATVPHALVWLGLECKSFVVLSRSQSLRSAGNQWMGDETKEFVQNGNALQEISALIVFLAKLMECVAALEQPLNSCAPLCRPLKGVLAFTAARMVTTYHGAYGGETVKPLQVWTLAEAFDSLRRPKPSQSRESALATRDYGGGFTGIGPRLKASQAYTRCFGDAVMAALRQHWQSLDLDEVVAA